jgi:hypothetical protein
MSSPKLCVDCRAPLPAAAARDVCESCVTVRRTASLARTCADRGVVIVLPKGPASP